jgi:hypothetical protein
MNRYFYSALVGGGLLFAGSMSANAAPLTPQAPTADTSIEKVHGDHRGCRRGHRHSRWGEWRSCGHYYRDSAPGVYLRFGGDRHRSHHRGHRHHDRHHR